MSEIKAGMTVIMRTTEEPLFVLGVSVPPVGTPSEYAGLTGTMVIVRRPVQDKYGVHYETAKFFIEEVETLDAKQERLETQYLKLLATQNAQTPKTDVNTQSN